jgi:hypothetical protein
MPEIPANLDEFRALFAHLPGPDLEAGTAAALRERQLTKPAGALGRLEELSHWLATWQGRHPPRLDHPRTSVFAGNHGVAARGVSAYPAAVTAQMVQNFIVGGAAVNQLCRVVDADLRVYEMNLDQPTADFVDSPAMSEADCAKAITYGMMAVEPGIDVLALGEMGIANTTSAAALCLALFGGSADQWTGPGTGVAGGALERKRAIVGAAVERHRATAGDALAQCWRRAWRGSRWCSMALPQPRRLQCCSASTRARSTTALSRMSRPSRVTGGCSTISASGRCSISACDWAKARARPWRSPSSKPPSPATTAWQRSPVPGSAGRSERSFPEPLFPHLDEGAAAARVTK